MLIVVYYTLYRLNVKYVKAAGELRRRTPMVRTRMFATKFPCKIVCVGTSYEQNQSSIQTED